VNRIRFIVGPTIWCFVRRHGFLYRAEHSYL